MSDIVIKGPKGTRIIKEKDAAHGYNLWEDEVVVEHTPGAKSELQEALKHAKVAEGELAAIEASIVAESTNKGA